MQEGHSSTRDQDLKQTDGALGFSQTREYYETHIITEIAKPLWTSHHVPQTNRRSWEGSEGRVSIFWLKVKRNLSYIIFCPRIFAFYIESAAPRSIVLSICPLHTNSGCGKERRMLIGPW